MLVSSLIKTFACLRTRSLASALPILISVLLHFSSYPTCPSRFSRPVPPDSPVQSRSDHRRGCDGRASGRRTQPAYVGAGGYQSLLQLEAHLFFGEKPLGIQA